MATAFMGYVLPFGQMSFWGATVITNLLSPFPSLIEWVSGGHYVYNPTLKRFFIFHPTSISLPLREYVQGSNFLDYCLFTAAYDLNSHY